jgi:hypothetical protein
LLCHFYKFKSLKFSVQCCEPGNHAVLSGVEGSAFVVSHSSPSCNSTELAEV